MIPLTGIPHRRKKHEHEHGHGQEQEQEQEQEQHDPAYGHAQEYEEHRHEHTDEKTYEKNYNDELIPCELCNMLIPFSSFQHHVDNHTTLSPTSSSLSSLPPNPTRATMSMTTRSMLTSTSAIAKPNPLQSTSTETSTETSISTSTSKSRLGSTPTQFNIQEREINTANIHHEPMLKHTQLPDHGRWYGMGVTRVSLRSPMPHEPLWKQDVVSCLIIGADELTVDYEDYPEQPVEDDCVYLPVLGKCKIIGFHPFCWYYERQLDHASKTHWIFRTNQAMTGTIVEICDFLWPVCKLPVCLHIEIHNILGYVSDRSVWRTHVTHFIMFHQLHPLHIPSNMIPSRLCQMPRCPKDPVHFSQDHPTLGLCYDHLNMLQKLEPRMYRLPSPYQLNMAQQIICARRMGDAGYDMSSSGTPSLPRSSSRRMSFHLLSMLRPTEHLVIKSNLYDPLTSRYHCSSGDHVMLYTGIGATRNWQQYMNGLKDDLDLLSIADSRFFSSPSFLLWISIIMHSDGEGLMVLGNGKNVQAVSSTTVSLDLGDVFSEFPPIIKCNIVMFIGSCTHSYQPYMDIITRLSSQRADLASHLYIIYCASDAFFPVLSTLQLDIVIQLMNDHDLSIPSAFQQVAHQQSFSDISPRLLCPNNQIIVPHDIFLPTVEIIPRALLHPLSASALVTVTQQSTYAPTGTSAVPFTPLHVTSSSSEPQHKKQKTTSNPIPFLMSSNYDQDHGIDVSFEIEQSPVRAVVTSASNSTTTTASVSSFTATSTSASSSSRARFPTTTAVGSSNAAKVAANNDKVVNNIMGILSTRAGRPLTSHDRALVLEAVMSVPPPTTKPNQQQRQQIRNARIAAAAAKLNIP